MRRVSDKTRAQQRLPWFHGRVSEATNITEVVDRLTDIVDRAIVDQARIGYFAALYRKVTIRVQEGIADGTFDDGPRMERLDVIFAQRFLDALDVHHAGGTPTRSWQFALGATDQWWPIVLQHLLLGMNAHINLDLGIAAAQTVPPGQLQDMRDDFNRINTILASMIADVQAELARVWRPLRVLNRFLGKTDDAIVRFSMNRARDDAWHAAELLSPLDDAERAREIDALDSRTLSLAHLVRRPGIVIGTAGKLIRLGERGSVADIIAILR